MVAEKETNKKIISWRSFRKNCRHLFKLENFSHKCTHERINNLCGPKRCPIWVQLDDPIIIKMRDAKYSYEWIGLEYPRIHSHILGDLKVKEKHGKKKSR